jgi:hypothetical protein
MAPVMFYERPVPLDRDRHRQLKLAIAPGHYRFAARVNSLPLMSTEFAEAARDYPIVFVGNEGGPFSVAALVGLRDQENLMVNEQGQWERNHYVPAFVRRYPFVLAKAETDDRLTVCIDEAYPGLGTRVGEPLFNEQGQHTPYLDRAIKFLQAFNAEGQRTAEFAQRLQTLGLLVPKLIHVDRQGQPRQTLRGVWIIDSARVRGLDNERVIELFRAGQLSWIEAHLLSLGNLARLVARLEGSAAVSDDSGPIAQAAKQGVEAGNLH